MLWGGVVPNERINLFFGSGYTPDSTVAGLLTTLSLRVLAVFSLTGQHSRRSSFMKYLPVVRPSL